MTNEDLIEFLYELAVKDLEESDFKPQNDSWWEKISALPFDQKIAYSIMICDQQILRGGFNAWFTNTYAQFAKYTIQGLSAIGANRYQTIVDKAFSIVRQNFDTYDDYRMALRKGSLEDLYNDDSHLCNFLERCTNEYCELNENNPEDLIILLANFLR